jgi:phosphatidylinositol glycan class O
MDNGEPLPSYEGLAAAFAKAKAEKERQEAAGLRGTTQNADADNKQGEVRFKAAHGLLIAFFTWLLLLHALGIYLFTTGFLLTRLVLDNKSECAVPPIELSKSYKPGSPEKGCWHPKGFEKAIVIIVDALRYDFTVPFQPTPGDEKPHHFHNSLPVFYETAVQQPHNAFLLPFIADPPTTTLIRLKGLTTGTLPTFLEAGSNFAGTAIEEDNLVAQLRDAGKRIVHLGDDTWQALFPGYFEPNLTHSYDSFNVWDLHTVDNGVTEHIFPLLNPANSSKWDVIFGHYLGVDHAGHRYGPEHPAMTAKLNQMDGVFREMIEHLDDKTLLVVMGDHGMDAKGDHGGESDDEIQSALWMYSKRPAFGRTLKSHLTPPATAKERPVAQIDLVPTLSLLLGMPIPFNNLGTPIQEAFVGQKGADYENLATVTRLTAAQIHRYQHEYARARGLDDSARASVLTLWDTANEVWSMISSTRKVSEEQWSTAVLSFSRYQTETLRICRALWARFDIPRMINGVGILIGSLAILGIYARGLQGDRTELTPVLLVRAVGGTVVGAIAGAGLGLAVPQFSLEHAAILSGAVGGIAGIGTAFWYIRRRVSSPFPTSIWGWTSVIMTIALSVGFASNSFTIWEDEILLHFLCTFGGLMLISSIRQKNVLDRALGCYHSILFVILTRVASLSRLCREEQMPYCKSTYYASANSSTSAIWQLAIPFSVAFTLPNLIRSYYKGTRSFQGSAVIWIDFALRFGLLLSAAYWTLDAADDGDWYPGDNGLLKKTKVGVAQITFAIAMVAGYSTFAWAKPFLNIETKRKGAEDSTEQVVADSGSSSIIIMGYANVHGTRYAFLITMWLLAVSLVQKPMGAGAIALAAWQIFSLFEIIDTNKLADTPVGPIVLGLLGSFHFFKTGHQATLASIQWETAFIPLHTIKYPWSPLLVVLNMFGAQILCAVAVPAVVLWKQPPKKRGLLGDVAKAVATHLLFYAVINLATTMWAGHLRRHLMLYRIFSPRFMTGAVVLLVVDVVAVFVAIGGVRLSFLSVAEVFGWS